MATQNSVPVQRQWSKTIGVANLDSLGNLTSTDALKQMFDQMNSAISDGQNVVYSSAALTGGGVTTPTMTAIRFRAGGTYGLSGTTIPALAGAGLVIPISSFALWYFTVDASATLRTYASAGNLATAVTRAGLTFPNPLPSANEAVFGAMEIATDATHTFTVGTTLLNAVGITTVFMNFTGDTGFTAFTMSEMDNA